jgi:hypothetical protein
MSAKSTSVGVAIGTQLQSHFDIRRNGNDPNTVVICGTEIITTLKEYNGAERMRLIPVNPMTWVHTRAQREARLYALYQPRKLSLLFIPSVGTTTDGNVVLGSLPVGINPGDDVTEWTRQLMASDGGVLSAPYYPVGTNYKCSGWEQPRWRLGAITEMDTNPFYMAALFTNSDADVTIGQLVVSYEFILSKRANPEYVPYETVQYDPVPITLANGLEVGAARTLGTHVLSECYVDLGDAKVSPGDIIITVTDEANSQWAIIRNGHVMSELTDLDGVVDGIYMKPSDER